MMRMSKMRLASPFTFGASRYNSHSSPILQEPCCFINNTFTPVPESTEVINPATGEKLGCIANCNADWTKKAIAAAEKAFPSWSTSLARDRALLLRKLESLMGKYHKDLAAIMTRESGKPLAEASGEITYASRYVEWYAGEAERVYGDIVSDPRPGVRTTIIKKPLGVVGIITPWNFPTAMITRAAAGALAAGCTVVLKPSELTPYSALALCQLVQEAGFPEGVFNVVVGDSEPIGSTMTESFAVRKISFTGSTRVGKLLMKNSADTVKKVAMELGGNAPLIVFADADMKRAVEATMNAKFRNAGQTCICANRIFVHESVHDTFVDAVVEKVRKIKLGDGLSTPEKGVTLMGPLITASAADRIAKVVEQAVKDGATVRIGGKRGPSSGHFYEPTVLTGCSNNMEVCRNEIFGPVMPVIKFSDKDDIIKMANDTRAGLAAYIFTEDYKKQWKVSEALQFGMVAINDGALGTPVAPFGGMKESGLGRDGSKYGIEAFLDIRYVLHSNL